VLNEMIQSRQNELQSKAIKQDCWNNREADRQAEKAFLEEHKGPGKFSGKYGPQQTQTELVWRMPCGCWLEYNDDHTLSEAWNAATEDFSEDWPSTVVHQNPDTRRAYHFQRKLQSEGLGSHARMDLSRVLHGTAKPNQQVLLPLLQSSRLQSLQQHYQMLRLVTPQQALPQCQRRIGMQLQTRQELALQAHHQALSCTSRRQLMPLQPCALRPFQQVLPQPQQIQLLSH